MLSITSRHTRAKTSSHTTRLLKPVSSNGASIIAINKDVNKILMKIQKRRNMSITKTVKGDDKRYLVS